MIAIDYHESIGETDCDQSIDVEADANLQYTAVCVEGRAEVFIFVYVGDDESFDPEECDGCNMPSDNSTGIVSYCFEFNCDCEIEPTPEPTSAPAPGICEEVTAVRATGAEVDLPLGAMEITDNTGDSVKFLINQLRDTSDAVPMKKARPVIPIGTIHSTTKESTTTPISSSDPSLRTSDRVNKANKPGRTSNC
jgi:hypothetical protein